MNRKQKNENENEHTELRSSHKGKTKNKEGKRRWCGRCTTTITYYILKQYGLDMQGGGGGEFLERGQREKVLEKETVYIEWHYEPIFHIRKIKIATGVGYFETY